MNLSTNPLYCKLAENIFGETQVNQLFAWIVLHEVDWKDSNVREIQAADWANRYKAHPAGSGGKHKLEMIG